MADFEVVIYDYTEYDKPEELVSYDMYVEDEINTLVDQFGHSSPIVSELKYFVDNYLLMAGAIIIYYVGKLLKKHISEDNIQEYAEKISLLGQEIIENDSYTPATFEFGEKRNMLIEVTRLFD